MQWLIGIDALRFFAIILIVIYHLFRSFMPGGFIAVEIFFTISGFLIISKLLKEYSQKRKISYSKFIITRLTRLLPTLLACVMLTLILAIFVHPDILSGMRDNTFAALTFTTNIKELITGGAYENIISPNLFEHTWFLALEMQFYLIAPILILLIVGQFKNTRSGAKCFLMVMICIAIISAGLMMLYGGLFGMPNRAYFALDSHFTAFCLGGVLGAFNYLVPRTPRTKKIIPAIGVALSLITIVILSFKVSFDNPIAFYFGLPFTSVLTVIMLFCIIKLQPNVHVRKRVHVLIRLFEKLGSYSYGIYLFHWPLYILLPHIFQNSISPSAIAAIVIVASVLLSILFAKHIHIDDIHKKSKNSMRYRIALTAVFTVFLIPSVFSILRIPQTSGISEQLSTQKTDVNNDNVIAQSEDYLGVSRALEQTKAATIAQLDVEKNLSQEQQSNNANAAESANTAQVLVIGDSVTLGAKQALEQRIDGVYVDAVESRGIWSARNILANYSAAGRLPDIIVVSLITNEATITDGLLQGIIDIAGPGHTFVFVTGYAGPQQPRETQNAALKDFIKRHDGIYVADWWALSHDNWSLMYADHIHLNPEGRAAYANLVNNIIRSIKQ